MLNFGAKFTQVQYFWSKTEKSDHKTELCIFELVLVQI